MTNIFVIVALLLAVFGVEIGVYMTGYYRGYKDAGSPSEGCVVGTLYYCTKPNNLVMVTPTEPLKEPK